MQITHIYEEIRCFGYRTGKLAKGLYPLLMIFIISSISLGQIEEGKPTILDTVAAALGCHFGDGERDLGCISGSPTTACGPCCASDSQSAQPNIAPRHRVGGGEIPVHDRPPQLDWMDMGDDDFYSLVWGSAYSLIIQH